MNKQIALPMETNALRKEVIAELCQELGYKGFDEEWGREHLIDGPHGDCYFSATTLDSFRTQIRDRIKIKKLEAQVKKSWRKYENERE